MHKLWLSTQDKRAPFKRRKDRNQDLAVLDAVAETMPHYPLDEAFIGSMELQPFWDEWREGRSPPVS